MLCWMAITVDWNLNRHSFVIKWVNCVSNIAVRTLLTFEGTEETQNWINYLVSHNSATLDIQIVLKRNVEWLLSVETKTKECKKQFQISENF